MGLTEALCPGAWGVGGVEVGIWGALLLKKGARHGKGIRTAAWVGAVVLVGYAGLFYSVMPYPVSVEQAMFAVVPYVNGHYEIIDVREVTAPRWGTPFWEFHLKEEQMRLAGVSWRHVRVNARSGEVLVFEGDPPGEWRRLAASTGPSGARFTLPRLPAMP